MTDRIFMNHQKKKIPDVIEYIREYFKEFDEYEIYVGCDSQVNRRHTVYSVAIGLRRIIGGIGHGVHVIHTREYEDLKSSEVGDIVERLWEEVIRVGEVAMLLRENDFDVSVVEPHVDANGKKFTGGSRNENYSNKIYSQALGYLRGLGFDNAKGKPEAFAATYAAGRYCK